MKTVSFASLLRGLEMRKMAHLAIGDMTRQTNKIGLAMRFSCIVSDAHFWVPLAVLIAGLLVLAWVS